MLFCSKAVEKWKVIKEVRSPRPLIGGLKRIRRSQSLEVSIYKHYD